VLILSQFPQSDGAEEKETGHGEKDDEVPGDEEALPCVQLRVCRSAAQLCTACRSESNSSYNSKVDGNGNGPRFFSVVVALVSGSDTVSGVARKLRLTYAS